jgi:mycofactocin glycosyltransferase
MRAAGRRPVAGSGTGGPGPAAAAVPPPAVVPPEAAGLAPDAGLPAGTVVRLDPGTQRLTDDVLFGGSPPRILRLSPAGQRALAQLEAGPVASAAAAALARRLTDANMAHPVLPAAAASAAASAWAASPASAASAGRPGPGVTVLIPARDRVAELRHCLAAAGTGYPVLVVDDGSEDPDAVRAAALAAGARLIRRPSSGGPAAARNTGLAALTSEFVAFLDSDCEPPPGWIDGLAGHFADPLVAAVAPRVVAVPGTGPALDQGGQPARVAPLTRVSYVPTAALVVRRSALGGGFDEALRYGEDVDLIWRLTGAGWRVRYEPAVEVRHAAAGSLTGTLHRRFRYGTSAAPLARRHPGALTPLILQPWPTLTMTALLARRPAAAAGSFTLSAVLLRRRLQAAGLPARGLAKPMAVGVVQTWLGTGRWCGQFGWPVLAAVIARPGGRTARARWGRRLAAASLLAGPPLAEATGLSGDGTQRLAAAARALAGQAAYGAGVYAGCLRERTTAPLRPTVAWQPVAGLRRTPPGKPPADPPAQPPAQPPG